MPCYWRALTETCSGAGAGGSSFVTSLIPHNGGACCIEPSGLQEMEAALMAIAHAGKMRLEACADVQGITKCQEELAVFAAMRVN